MVRVDPVAASRDTTPSAANDLTGPGGGQRAHECAELRWSPRLGAREPDELLLGLVCECATTGCTTRVEMSLEEYRLARERPNRFLVAPGHVDSHYERVVLETDRFALIQKFGLAGEIASDDAD